RKAAGSAFVRVAFQVGACPSSRVRLDYRKLAVFADQWRQPCNLQKSRLQRRAKRRIALNYNRKMFLRFWFTPGDYRWINPMLIPKDRIGDGKCFTAFE